MAIVGRDEELHRIVDWLEAGAPRSTDDPSRPLVLEGEPGIGKTTLWTAGVREARERGSRCLTARPSLSEAALSHVGLFDLVEPLSDAFLPSLPPPQRHPLERALLRADRPMETELDPRAVAMGLTALLRAASGEEPIVIAVDDVQWLDAASARALAFAMRRTADRVSFLLALRTGDPATSRRQNGFAIIEREMGPAGMDRIQLEPLSLAATHHVIRDRLGATFGRPTLVRIHVASGGNPFYALEIAREALASGTDDPAEPLAVPASQRDLALLRVRRLPRPTREALLEVAALARPSISEVDPAALAPAERAGIVRVEPEGRIAFEHPLFGSALYAAAPAATRRHLHRTLAMKVESLDERARHRALGADGPDEPTARLLDDAAGSAAGRGDPDLAVELAELARRLTPPGDAGAVVRRDLALADRRYFAGDAHGARRDLERSLTPLPSGDLRAEVLLELGSVVWTQGDIAGLEMFDRALQEAESPKLRARIHSRASAFAEDCDVAYQHAEAALALLDADEEPFLYGFALHNMALWKLYAGFGADHGAITRGMELQRDMASWEMSTVPAFWSRNLDDFATARTRFEDLLRAFGDHGDEASTCGITAQLAIVEAMTGHIDRARKLAEEAVDLAEQTGQEGYLNAALNAAGQVCVWAGDLDGARAAGRAIFDRVRDLPDLIFEAAASAILGSAAFAEGDPAEADKLLSAADDIEEARHCREPAPSRFHGDLAEAVIELGDLERAERVIDRMERRAEVIPRPWILAVSARCRGILRAARGDLDGAMADLGLALQAHEALDMPIERARTLLSLGRIHRRRKEKGAADRALRAAVAIFDEVGSEPWAARARSDLARVGLRPKAPEDLTETERRVAVLAAGGMTNRTVASETFLAPKTVEKILSRVYRKLGIASRAELGAWASRQHD